ncbi:MAG: Mobile element protein, partial [uncultured Rubrobacteraceae bacterium]
DRNCPQGRVRSGGQRRGGHPPRLARSRRHGRPRAPPEGDARSDDRGRVREDAGVGNGPRNAGAHRDRRRGFFRREVEPFLAREQRRGRGGRAPEEARPAPLGQVRPHRRGARGEGRAGRDHHRRRQGHGRIGGDDPGLADRPPLRGEGPCPGGEAAQSAAPHATRGPEGRAAWALHGEAGPQGGGLAPWWPSAERGLRHQVLSPVHHPPLPSPLRGDPRARRPARAARDRDRPRPGRRPRRRHRHRGHPPRRL